MSRTVWNAGGAIAALGRPPDATAPKPAEEGAIFHALLDAGVEAKLAYTAEKRMHTMTSETVAEHTRPILKEVSQLTTQVRDLTEMVRGLAGEVRDLTGKVRDLAETVAENHRTVTADIQALKEAEAEQDRKLDVLSAQMRLVIGAFGLLITALIAVFGILFTK
ncbi:MAG: hypothetical protein F4198_07190 [Acidobacteria bacterium]|nr:hypothetical protein [Acidobacteriota bacterium]